MISNLDEHWQLIHLQVHSKTLSLDFTLIVVYGANKLPKRRGLWTKLRILANEITQPWLVGEGFNNVLSPSDIQGDNEVQLYEIVDFQGCLRDCQLTDIKWKGAAFTWNNNQRADIRVCTKINRVLTNGDWICTFPEPSTMFQPGMFSDNALAIIKLALSGSLCPHG